MRGTFEQVDAQLVIADNIADSTIKGETRPVTFTGEFTSAVVDAFGVTRAGASVSATISRKDFGITWNAAVEAGGVLV